MSKIIKFRAWDKKNGYYADYEDIEEEITAQAIDGWRSKDGGTSFTLDYGIKDFELEQYTGLKDENGKEIYAEDIVEEDIDFNSKMTDGTFRYKVYWNEDELCWSLDPIGPESIHRELWELNSSRRIIGNVHENKELWGESV